MNSKFDEYKSEIIEHVLKETSKNEAYKIRNRMLLAAKIDDAIKAKGWKKLDLAKRLNKKPSVISKWISGTHNFTTDTLWDIERLLDINLIELDKTIKEQSKTYYIYLQSPEIESETLNYDSLLNASIESSQVLEVKPDYKKIKNKNNVQPYS